MPNNVPSLSQLSLDAAYELHRQDDDLSVRIATKHIDIISILPIPLHKLALDTLNSSYRTLVLQPLERKINQKQTQYQGYSVEDLDAERLTKLALKELEGFKTLYWLARANDLQAIVSFIETEKKDCAMLFSTLTRDAVVAKLAERGYQEYIDKLLNLANHSSERMSMLTSGIEGACKGGQIAILHHLFEEKCQTEDDKTCCQNYLTMEVSSLLSKACASGNLESVEFILERQPETEHKKIISEDDKGFQYHALCEACRSGNLAIVDRLLKPFSQEEIDRIFLPTPEEANKLPLPLSYASILSYGSVQLNQHILTKLVSQECREKLVTSKTFVESLTQAYSQQDAERSLGLLSQVSKQQFELVKQAVSLALNDKQAQEVVKQRFEKECEILKGSPSVVKSRLAHSQFFAVASSSKTENKSGAAQIQDSLFFCPSEQAVKATKKDQQDRQRCPESRLTKN